MMEHYSSVSKSSLFLVYQHYFQDGIALLERFSSVPKSTEFSTHQNHCETSLTKIMEHSKSVAMTEFSTYHHHCQASVVVMELSPNFQSQQSSQLTNTTDKPVSWLWNTLSVTIRFSTQQQFHHCYNNDGTLFQRLNWCTRSTHTILHSPIPFLYHWWNNKNTF